MTDRVVVCDTKTMPVKLWKNSTNNIHDPIKTIMDNRGVNDYSNYLNPGKECLYDPHLLDNIDEAARIFVEAMDNSDELTILVDCDPDGFTSAALVFNYIKRYECKSKVNILIHDKKIHGLGGGDVHIPETTKLLIIPDAGSSDVRECKALSKDMKIIILDHHVCTVKNDYAVVVNNQMCSYPNKELSGVGIVYKFLQVVDEITWYDLAENDLDLVALGNIADVMDMRSTETRYLCLKGLANIQNPLMAAFVEKNSFYIKDVPTIVDIQFSFAPPLNAVIRIGTMEQKKMIFDAMTYSKDTYKYKNPRKPELGEIDEPVAAKVARESASCKTKQNRMKDKGIEEIRELITKYGWDKNKILFCNASGILEQTLTGLAAINLAEEYNRPCVLLRSAKDDSDVFGGSCRNISGGNIENLQEFLLSTGEFISVDGHENAAGVRIRKDHIQSAIAACNEMLKDVDTRKFYVVDFSIDYYDLDVDLIRKVYAYRRAWGPELPEPRFLIKGIPLERTHMHVLGKQSNTWKYADDNTGIEFVRFTCPVDEPVMEWINEAWDSQDEIYINAVGTLDLNQYGSKVTPQVKVICCEVC